MAADISPPADEVDGLIVWRRYDIFGGPMASRQDQLQSYQFVVQRVISALVVREPDPVQRPFRRVLGAVLVGVLLSALGVGGAAALAVLRPGSSGKWRNDKAVIVEAESGALFVYRDDVLHPVLNQASALLILNTAGAATVVVPRSALAAAPRGESLGIPGAPASLPPAAALRKDAWTVCSTPDGSVLFVGGGPSGGTPAKEKGILVNGPDRQAYLLWRGFKHLIRQPGAVLPALVWSSRPVVEVAQALLHAIPSGTDLAIPTIVDRGRTVAAGKVGQVFAVTTGDRQEAFVVTADGLASITPLQAQLLLAAPETQSVQPGGRSLSLTPADLTKMVPNGQVKPFAVDPGGEGALPAAPPELLESHFRFICTASALTIDPELPDLTHALRTPSATAAGAVLADRVVVPAGSGALVRTDTGVLTLVTDLGKRHAIPSPDVLGALGYAGVQPATIPAAIVALLPSGPALDPAAANAVVQ
ncbi:type VII secretion protein EccB [Dactylosporangium vinaceum]|uniref:Type VII secretion protein EccB n=1 Tax=Dactylosporangium vinaceum TaxID=53362 RepID=A0ABV5MLW6_9ACTN|nr:type VII secretion protein EccB [Dactylosporangium vinaceum]UAB96842.1 type VII secretion protein EccB [Dactylosporangium vinaceum]